MSSIVIYLMPVKGDYPQPDYYSALPRLSYIDSTYTAPPYANTKQKKGARSDSCQASPLLYEDHI